MAGSIRKTHWRLTAVSVALHVAVFYSPEWCGLCTPCRVGSDGVRKLIGKFRDGEGTKKDLDRLWSVTTNMDGTTICALAEALVWPVQSFLKKYPEEFKVS